MNAAGFARCLGVEVFKLRRTMALALAVLLPAAPVLMFLVYLLQRGSAEFPRGVSAASWAVQGLLSLWAIFVLPVFAAVESSLLAAIEHENRGWKHLFALPPTRGSLLAAKFIVAALLVTIAHAFLFVYTILLLWTVPKLSSGAGFVGSIPLFAVFVVIATCAVSSLFMVGVHTWIALRWPSFALNVGIALGGLLCVFVVLESRLRAFLPWSQPGAAQNIVVPWIFGWAGAPAGPGSLLIVLGISAGGFAATAAIGGWLLSRRDIF